VGHRPFCKQQNEREIGDTRPKQGSLDENDKKKLQNVLQGVNRQGTMKNTNHISSKSSINLACIKKAEDFTVTV
jgi:hypothetical protein